MAFAALTTAAVGFGVLAATMVAARALESPPSIAALIGVAVGALYGAGVTSVAGVLRRREIAVDVEPIL